MDISEIYNKYYAKKDAGKYLASITFTTAKGVEVKFKIKDPTRKLMYKIGSRRWATKQKPIRSDVDPTEALLQLKAGMLSKHEI